MADDRRAAAAHDREDDMPGFGRGPWADARLIRLGFVCAAVVVALVVASVATGSLFRPSSGRVWDALITFVFSLQAFLLLTGIGLVLWRAPGRASPRLRRQAEEFGGPRTYGLALVCAGIVLTGIIWGLKVLMWIQQ